MTIAAMHMDKFEIDPRLEGDTTFVIRLPLCDVRLMDDARFAWLVLVPRRAGAEDLFDLDPDDRVQLLTELDRAASALRAVVPCDKLNLGALGNIVRQLHVHVVARRQGDAAWPGPVWGQGQRRPRATDAAETLLRQLQARLVTTRGAPEGR